METQAVKAPAKMVTLRERLDLGSGFTPYILVLPTIFFFKETATTEIYTSVNTFPYTTLFRSICTSCRCASISSARPEGWRGCSIARSEEHTSELQSLTDISYAVFCLKKKK